MKKKCVICGKSYVYIDRGTNKGTCRSESCRAKRYYRDNREAQKARYKKEYHHNKKHNYAQLRKANQKAVARKRFGVDSRDEILRRFNNQCANCGSTKNLVIHHIDNQGRKVQKPNNLSKNLTVLCRGCHVKHHTKNLQVKV